VNVEVGTGTSYDGEAVRAVMPIGEPFLFLDQAAVSTVGARGTYTITGEEFFLRGHFKGNPVMPASVMLEALGQLGVFWLLTGLGAEALGGEGRRVDPGTIFFASCDGVRCHRVCKPGDVLELSVKPRRVKAPLAVLEGVIRVAGQKAVVAEEITLTFGAIEA
jgi:3-hydroxyacyl-[acyl-carrier-protein] dehydratase